MLRVPTDHNDPNAEPNARINFGAKKELTPIRNGNELDRSDSDALLRCVFVDHATTVGAANGGHAVEIS